MILAASGITGLVVTVLMRMRIFTPAAQLTMRSHSDTLANPSSLVRVDAKRGAS
jgi:hypothetical protein